MYRLLWLVIIVSFSFSTCTSAQEASIAVQQRLDRQWWRYEPPTARMSARDLFSFAFESTAQKWRPDRVELALSRAAEMQDVDPSSTTYGNFKWYWESDGPHDRNAVEFCMQKGTLLWIRYKDRMSDEGRRTLEKMFRLSVEGIRRHRVPVTYTNIFLMKTWNCIALGEILDDSDLADAGYLMLDQWLRYTYDNGIHEYGSPTYYGVDLDSLGLISRYAQRLQGRQAAIQALQLIWTDIGLNWYAPSARLGGAHSRDYDYLTGHGYLDQHLQMANWITPGEPTSQWEFFRSCRGTVPIGVRELTKKIPRVVVQRWGGERGQTATHYVGHHFSLGSSGANYGPMDKTLVVNLGSGASMPVVSFFQDGRGDPYGKQKVAQASGHTKALHLMPFITSVQRENEVLFLAAADPDYPGTWRHSAKPTCLYSHLILPVDPTIWIGEHRLDEATLAERTAIGVGRPIFLRHMDVAVAIRWVLADNLGDDKARLELVNDGTQYGVRRLTCTHAESTPTSIAVASLWLRCEEGLDEDEFSAFRARFTSDAFTTDRTRSVVRMSVEAHKGRLQLNADLAGRRGLPINDAGQPVDRSILSIDGRDVGREILEQVASIDEYRKLLESTASGNAGAFTTEQVIEAEQSHWLLPPFATEDDDGASRGACIWIPGPIGQGGSGPTAEANWLVHIPKPGDYLLWARVRAPTSSDDSFYVRVEQDRREILAKVDWHTGVHKRWAWIPFRANNKPGDVPLHLNRGAARIQILGREDGTQLDAILLTADQSKSQADLPSPANQRRN